MVGPTTTELDSFNELIQFDHVYYKTQPEVKASSQGQGQTVQVKDGQLDLKSIVNKLSNQKVTENGTKTVKIIITSEPNVTSSKNELHIPDVILDTKMLQNPANDFVDLTKSDIMDTTAMNIDETILSEDALTDLNFDLLEDLESILQADCEGLASPEGGNTVSHPSDAAKTSSEKDCNSVQHGIKRKHPEVDAIVESLTTESLVSPTKSSSVDSDYASDVPSPYSMYSSSSPIPANVGSPIVEASPLSDCYWEESFTELFPDLL